MLDGARYSPMSVSEAPPLYLIWPGGNTPICSGRCLCGPHSGVFFWNVLLNVGLGTLFCVFVAYPVHLAVLIIFFPFWFASLFYLFAAMWTEPGIIPRGADVAPNTAGSAHATLTTILVDGAAREVTQEQAAAASGLKYCTTCRIYRPPRSKHCRDCDQCVKEFDHHCPWINNCVGERNYRFFVLFLLSLSLMISYILIVCIYQIVVMANATNFGASISANPVVFILVICGALFGCCVCQLAGYHCYLIDQGVTTNEDVLAVPPIKTTLVFSVC